MTVETPSTQALLRFCWRIRRHLFLPIALTATACSEPQRPSDEKRFAPREAEQIPIGQIPEIGETRSYRCEKNDVVYVDYFRDGTGAVMRTRDGRRTRLVATTVGGPFITRDGTLERNASDIFLTRDGGSPQTCAGSK